MKKLIGILFVTVVLAGCDLSTYHTTSPTVIDEPVNKTFKTNSSRIEIISICDVEENVEYMYVSPKETYDGSSLIMLKTSYDKPKPCHE